MLPVVMLMGPTASGKTGLALALAERFNVEIVSVDSVQVYRGMDIGTAKPDEQLRRRVPHHLIDILDPSESYSAARFAEDARALIAQIRARSRIPLLVGGTMLYFRALHHGLSELPSADPVIRAQLEATARSLGWPALHARLAQYDPATAARLHPNDQQRIQRALEIIASSGQLPSMLFASNRTQPPPGPVVRLALNPPERAELHRRIGHRFVEMMEQGFVDEVARLRGRGDLTADLPSMRAVGYRQLWEYLDGRWSKDDAVARAMAATRQLAKRQLTWLRAEAAAGDGLEFIDPDRADLLSFVAERIDAAVGL